jgi:hypothetical protein
METETDPKELAAAQARRAAFDRNADWLESHAAEVYSHRGKHVCIAGEQLFVGDTAEQVLLQAQKAHPHDVGVLLRYVPRERVPRIYSL